MKNEIVLFENQEVKLEVNLSVPFSGTAAMASSIES